MNAPRGIRFALISVILGSAAQLAMRWGMTRLPLPSRFLIDSLDSTALIVVAAAIFAYALSMVTWLGALRHLPLGRAYSLLSISYALVYLLAAALPMFNEAFSLSRSLGVALVVLGVMTINSRP